MKMYIIVEDTGLGKSFTSVFVNGYKEVKQWKNLSAR